MPSGILRTDLSNCLITLLYYYRPGHCCCLRLVRQLIESSLCSRGVRYIFGAHCKFDVWPKSLSSPEALLVLWVASA